MPLIRLRGRTTAVDGRLLQARALQQARRHQLGLELEAGAVRSGSQAERPSSLGPARPPGCPRAATAPAARRPAAPVEDALLRRGVRGVHVLENVLRGGSRERGHSPGRETGPPWPGMAACLRTVCQRPGGCAYGRLTQWRWPRASGRLRLPSWPSSCPAVTRRRQPASQPPDWRAGAAAALACE